MSTGFDRQLNFKEESAWGTAAATTMRSIPLKSDGDGLGQTIEMIESDSQFAGAFVMRSAQWAQGNIDIAGTLTMEVFDKSIGLWLKHAMGSVSTTGTAPTVHTFTPGSLSGLGMTAQLGRVSVDGTVRVFTYAGLKVNKWTWAASVGNVSTLAFDVVGYSETTNTTLSVANYTSGLRLMTYVGGQVRVNGVTNGVNVQSFTLTGDNKLNVARRKIGEQYILEPLGGGADREYTGVLNMEFYDATTYALFTSGSEAGVVLVVNNNATSGTLRADLNVRLDGITPRNGNDWPIVVAVPFKCVGPSTDAGAITLTYTTLDLAP